MEKNGSSSWGIASRHFSEAGAHTPLRLIANQLAALEKSDSTVVIDNFFNGALIVVTPG